MLDEITPRLYIYLCCSLFVGQQEIEGYGSIGTPSARGCKRTIAHAPPISDDFSANGASKLLINQRRGLPPESGFYYQL